MGGLLVRDLLFGASIRAPDSWKLPSRVAHCSVLDRGAVGVGVTKPPCRSKCGPGYLEVHET